MQKSFISLAAALCLLSPAIACAGAGASAPGATYKADAEGWQVKPPKAWKHAEKDGKIVFGSDTEAGLMLAWFQAGATLEQVKQSAGQPYQEPGLMLTPGKSSSFAGTAGKAIAVDYEGTDGNGSPLKARAIAIVGKGGAVYAVGITTPPQFAKLSKRVDELAKGVSFFAAKAGDVALLSGPVCAYSGSSSGSSSYSSTQRMTFDGRGHVAWGSESAFSGSTQNMYGDTTATWGGYGGNQNTPTSGGTYSVSGNSVKIHWGDGTTLDCTVHYRNGRQITELQCGSKLYGRGLCE